MIEKPGRAPPVAPQQLLPVEQEPFTHIMSDCAGPLPKSKRGNEYLFTILDVATRYSEAIPLRSIRAKTIVEHLLSSPGQVSIHQHTIRSHSELLNGFIAH